ncbi:MAG: patatin-like phospholipase family protein [Nitrococcus mobilis]|nr:patatin-like phospholipase family protein [Nitrococcus mobilis]
MHTPADRPRIGIALGSGSARGWAHIGVLRGLGELGLKPDLVAGTSCGAIVGAIYASGHLRIFERWVRRLTRREVVSLLDLAVGGGGGFFEGRRLINLFVASFGDLHFDQLRRPLGVVATDLYTGREHWLREGSVVEAIRASMALPGLFTPSSQKGRWLVDGGLVNPVPVSLCHAMGADAIIAVNLNGDLIGRHLQPALVQASSVPDPVDPATRAAEEFEPGLFDRVSTQLRERAAILLGQFRAGSSASGPGLFEVMTTAINIMQDRITRSRMAGDPPDLLLSPRLSRIGLLEFARGAEAIEEGYKVVRRMQPAILDFMASIGYEPQNR